MLVFNAHLSFAACPVFLACPLTACMYNTGLGCCIAAYFSLLVLCSPGLLSSCFMALGADPIGLLLGRWL